MRVSRIDQREFRITPVALVLLFLLVGVSLVFGLSGDAAQARMASWLVPTSESVWREGKVWTLLTGPFLQPRVLSLFIEALMLWMLMPRLERWWGPRRFLLFVGLTALAGTTAGTLAGLALDEPAPIVGLNPAILAGTIAFGVLYARAPVQFFGVLPLTGAAVHVGHDRADRAVRAGRPGVDLGRGDGGGDGRRRGPGLGALRSHRDLAAPPLRQGPRAPAGRAARGLDHPRAAPRATIAT
jgi:membrane associated rhomboid family serine protease